MPEFRYKAFVSYSWSDGEWGKWLLQAIETYRTPAALIGKETPSGPVPARLQPLFKDREEEAAGASIGQAIETALAASEFLIVICSPRSAQSKWVDREIAWFKTHRDPTKILALIVDGNPGSADAECFPRALTHRVAADRTVTDEPVDAPLAADARISGDGKRRAKLKLAAAMLGVGLDELVNRDERRRTVRTRLVVGASLALALVMTGMAIAAVRARNEADHQRAESDGLVEFMLTDLRQRLEPVGRLDALDVVGQRALKYYAGQTPGSLDPDALGRRARALHLVGEVSNLRGDSVAGLNAFRQAAAATKEQLARDPNNPQRIFDHAQSVFWVGYIALERGDAAEAERQFGEYKQLADQLIALEPGKPEWQMEVSYAESNLGIIYYNQGRNSEAVEAFSKSLAAVHKVAVSQPNDLARQLEAGTALNWLGKAQAELHHVAEALALQRQEIALYRAVLQRDPANAEAKRALSVAWQHVGRLELIAGRPSEAILANGTALVQIQQLRRIEPANTEWQEIEVRALIGQADNFFYAGRHRERDELHSAAAALLERMIGTDPKNAVWRIGLHSDLDTQQAMFRMADHQPREALTLANAALEQLRGAGSFDPLEKAKLEAKAQLTAGDCWRQLGDAARARLAWQSGLAAIDQVSGSRSSLVLRTRWALLMRLGRLADAAAITAELTRQGDHHPAWLRETAQRSR
jgi:tetratricopeptide (TPR) repeat protein